MNIQEIEEIIKNGENSAVEFKEANVKPDVIANEITAFANTYGGLLFLGINDYGEVTGIKDDFNYEEWIMNIARNNTIPSTTISYTEYFLDKKKIAIVNIPKGNDRPYQTQKGKSLHGQCFQIMVGTGLMQLNILMMQYIIIQNGMAIILIIMQQLYYLL